MTEIRYIIISPVKNEAEYIHRTIESVVSQTIRPARWIIVNDGSTDGTGRIVAEAAARNSWIKSVERENCGVRRAGSGVVEAFYSGFELLENDHWDFLVKLDGDLSFEPDYFERCFARFDKEPRLGIAGGLVLIRDAVDGSLSVESKMDPAYHVRGATKIYRRECWRDIDGLVNEVGWDTVDELKANMFGWSTRTLPDVKVVHHRPSGAAYGTWRTWVKNGRANYVSGYHPVFMLLKCISRIFERPYGMAALGLWVGYWCGYAKRMWRVDDPAFVRYFRRQQLRRLLGQPSLWSSGGRGPGGN
jgi:glycosyltransferase involved in cell wall biosynthesis